MPTAFILILQQTLLMGAATLGGVAFEQGGHGARGFVGIAAFATTIRAQGSV